jgi:hypothetical protein
MLMVRSVFLSCDLVLSDLVLSYCFMLSCLVLLGFGLAFWSCPSVSGLLFGSGRIWINLSFHCCYCRLTMTRVLATEVDLYLMRGFLEEARLAFLMVPVGATMEEVNAFFWHWAARGRRSVPANVWVVVRVRGHYRRYVRMQRWTQRQLVLVREATVARCGSSTECSLPNPGRRTRLPTG